MASMTTLLFYPNRDPRMRLFALWYFTILISLWSIAGHLLLGFEQSYAQPLVAVAVCIAAHFLLEWISARTDDRAPRFSGSWLAAINFLPAAIIPGLACAMLLYANERLMPVIFAALLSISSKVLFRAPVGGGGYQHIFNPSNFGITATLLLFPGVGLAPPYQFTENVTGIWHIAIPAIILVSGIFIHAKFTGRLPLIIGWLVGFAAQGLIRAAVFGIPWGVPFVPMTSAAFTLFTLYMIPDPATTPINRVRQVLYGLLIAAIYGLLFVAHVVFGLFIALAAASLCRGIGLYVNAALLRRRTEAKGTVGAAVATAAAAR
jgi:enediyne biosynthesis protein E5